MPDPFLNSFTRVLQNGEIHALQLADLFDLPDSLCCENTQQNMNLCADTLYGRDRKSNNNGWSNKPIWLLWRVFLASYGRSFLYVGFLKFLTCLLSFVGPLLLNQLVKLIENGPTQEDIPFGVGLTGALFIGLLLSSLLNAQMNINSAILQMKFRGALTRAIFSRALDLRSYELRDIGVTEGEISNMIQIDVSKVSDAIGSLHDLWSLPCLLLIAFILLYFQVKLAFLAGVFIIIIMIPLNSYVAKQIGAATTNLMAHKDKRVSFISEAIRGIKSIKFLGLEEKVFQYTHTERTMELKYLSTRKYLDAVCVFLWASLPVLVPFFTFLTTILIGEHLTTSEVFTTIALLNMLIFPMNSFPWVINGIVEAYVSAKRILVLLYSTERDESSSPGVNDPIGKLILGRVNREKALDFSKINEVDFSDLFPSHNVTATHDREVAQLPELNYDGFYIFEYVHSIVMKDVIARWSGESVQASSSNSSNILVTALSNERSSSEFGSALFLHDSVQFSLGPLSVSLPTEKGPSRDLFICICGSVGAGKSMFLSTILREVFICSGQLHFCRSVKLFLNAPNSNSSDRTNNSFINISNQEEISYCSQIPGMYAGSLRRNITISGTYKLNSLATQRRYNMIFEGCCLHHDFYNSDSTLNFDRESRLSDLTEVGQNGSRLSGGQRLRVGLARALYANTPIVLLDDPLSALDESTSETIITFLKQFSHKENRLIILTSHKIHLLRKEVDRIFLFQGGACVADGNLSDLSSNEEFNKLLEGGNITQYDASISRINEQNSNIGDTAAELKIEPEAVLVSSSCAEVAENIENAECVALETSKTGRIAFPVYISYLSAAGVALVVVVVMSTFLMQVTAIMMQYWLAYWTEHADNDISDSEFVTIFGAIAVANVIFALVRSFSFAKAGLNACQLLYEKITLNVFCAPLGFFESSSLGRIVNRFGKETERIDDNLPFIMNIVLAQFFQFCGALIIITVSNYFMIAIIIGALIRYFYLQRFYRASSREVRRLESTYRSPLYTLVSDCLGDAQCIRATRMLLFNLEELIKTTLDDSLRVSLASCYSSQWLNIRLQSLGAIITASVGLIATLCAVFDILHISPGMLGLSLAMSFSLVGNLNGLVNAVTETEQEMISVERIREYCEISSEFSIDEIREISKNSFISAVHHSCCCKLTCKFSNTKRRNSKSMSDVESQFSQSSQFDAHLSGSNAAAEMIKSILISDDLTPIAEDQVLVHLLDLDSLNDKETNSSIIFTGVNMNYRNFDHGRASNQSADNEQVHVQLDSRNVLNDIRLVIPGGSRVALCGKTGSGKTSLFRLLLGINDYSGMLTIGCCEVKSMKKRLLRKEFVGVIPQDPFLFSGSLRMNLDPFGEFTDVEIVEALNKTKISATFGNVLDNTDSSHLAISFSRQNITSDTLDSQINTGGSRLSVGQRQLLCLARCILRKSRVVLVDEATSSLDPSAEVKLLEALVETLSEQTTIIIICHNVKAVLPFCNLLIELEKGRVVRQQQILKT